SAMSTITTSRFTDNGAQAAGGAVFSESDITVTGSTFTGNQANAIGGGLANGGVASRTIDIMASTFENNSSLAGGGGVGVYGRPATLNVAGSTFTLNTAPGGAAIFTIESGGDSADEPVVVTNSTITDNIANERGGGFFASQVFLVHSTVV